jgi:hypothetical protein
VAVRGHAPDAWWAAVAWLLLLAAAAFAGLVAMVSAMRAGTWPAMALFVLAVLLTVLSALGVIGPFAM